MRQDIDLASEGSIKTLEFLDRSPPPNHPFDYALPAPPPAPAVQTAFGQTQPHNNDYWQMGGPCP